YRNLRRHVAHILAYMLLIHNGRSDTLSDTYMLHKADLCFLERNLNMVQPIVAGANIEGFATVTEACQYLRVSRATLYKIMEEGDLQYAKMRRSRRIHWSALRAYAQKSLVTR